MNFESLSNKWQQIFDELVEKQGETIIFFVRQSPSGTGVDDVRSEWTDWGAEPTETYNQYEVQGVVFRDLYGSDVSESENFAIREVGIFKPGDIAVQMRKEDLDIAFGSVVNIEDVHYVTIEYNLGERYKVKNLVARGLGRPPYIYDLFLRKITK